MAITSTEVKLKSMPIKPYCYFANESDEIIVTDWANGEGVDVAILRASGTERISLTLGEIQALTTILNYME